MIKIVAGIFLLINVTGCSSQKEISYSEPTAKTAQVNAPYMDTSRIDTDLTSQAMDHFIDGAINEAKGEYASAILDYQDALRLNPRAGIYYAIAKNYYFLNKYPSALQNCKTAVSLEPDQLDYQDLLANIFSAAGQFDSAAVVLERIIGKDSSRVQSYYKLARIYENSKPLTAIEIYNKLTDIIGPDWDILIRISQLYESLGQTDNAVLSLKKLLSIDPSNSSVQKLLIQLYEKAKKYDEALKIVDDILQFNPNDLDARQLKAQLYLGSG